jgi:hypothetical protein
MSIDQEHILNEIVVKLDPHRHIPELYAIKAIINLLKYILYVLGLSFINQITGRENKERKRKKIFRLDMSIGW